MSDSDWGHIFAAARMGAFDDAFARWGYRPEGVKETVGTLKEMFSFGHTRVLLASTPKGFIPVGVVVAGTDGVLLEPHVTWFKWASPRNKIETIAQYLREMRHGHTLLIKSEERFKEFWVRMCQLSVLRRVGTIHLLDGEPITVWQSWGGGRAN